MAEQLVDRIHAIAARVEKGSAAGTKPEIQVLLGKVLSFLPDARLTRDSLIVARIEIAVDALLKTPANVELAEHITNALTAELREYRNWLSRIWYGHVPRSYFLILGSGLITLALAALFVFPPGKVSLNTKSVLDLTVQQILLAVEFGALGSIVSTMLRIDQFDERHDVNSSLAFFTGLVRPLIGSIFAVVILVLVKSELLGFTIKADVAAIAIVLGFLSGFSERFAPSIFMSTEARLSKEK